MSNDRLDKYIKDREGYDQFFQNLLYTADNLNEEGIQDIYLLSSIKNS